MKPIIINYLDFLTPSGMHIFHLANAICRQGTECIVYSLGDPETVSNLGTPEFQSYGWKNIHPRDLAAKLRHVGGEYIIHTWTPRETVRHMALALLKHLPSPYVVHMEDNEENIIESAVTLLANGDAGEAMWNPGGTLFSFSHPDRYKQFLAEAQGYTCIIDTLLDFKPEHVPGHVLWPSCEEIVFSLPRESTAEAKARWGIPENCLTLFYPGAAHGSNYKEVVDLYYAVKMLHDMGIPIRIVKFGNYIWDIPLLVFKDESPECVVELTGKISTTDVPEVMRAVDVLVQPGKDNAFNHYRFPCKLPLFLASGRPVILPAANLGNHLTHGSNCLLLQEGTAEEIFSCLLFLIRNPLKARSIGLAGRAYARDHFDWNVSAKALISFYHSILDKWKQNTSALASTE